MKNKKIKSNLGVTLIELLISIAILSIISIGFFKFINIAIKMNVKNEKDIQAMNIAQSEIEQLRQDIKNNSLVLEDGQWVSYSTHSFLESGFEPEFVQEYNIKEIFNQYIEKEVDDTNNVANNKFIVKILLYRQKKSNSNQGYLYTIDMQVSNKDNTLSKRVIKLRYQVFG